MKVTKRDRKQDSVHPRQDHTEHILDTGTPGMLVHYPLLMELTFYCASDPAVRFNDARNRGSKLSGASLRNSSGEALRCGGLSLAR
jgi:hypothetical protein